MTSASTTTAVADRPMRVVLINHSDTRGGASVVTRRLMHALRARGVDARMLVVHRATDDPYIEVAASSLRCRVPFMLEHLRIAAGNGFERSTLFKLSIATDGLPLDRHPLVKQADAVMLNWVNQGMLSASTIGRIAAARPVVWTMHDMWNLTGACHHAGECTRYQQDCGRCPLIHDGRYSNDLSRRTWQRKLSLYDGGQIRFVAVSRWLADKAAGSSLLAGRRVDVIPNAFPVADYSREPLYTRADLGLPAEMPLIAMGAARLDDPIKNLPKAIEALNLLHDRGVRAHAVFFGDLRDPAALDGLRLPHSRLGTLDGERVRAVYAASKVVLSSSHYETLPGTLIEGQAAGAVPVSFGRGGQADIIDHGLNGYIAAYDDAADLSVGLEWALTAPIVPSELRRSVAERFDADRVAARYQSLISDLLAGAGSLDNKPPTGNDLSTL